MIQERQISTSYKIQETLNSKELYQKLHSFIFQNTQMTQTRLNILDQKPALSSKSKPVTEKQPLLVAPAATTSLSRFFPSFSAKLAASSLPAAGADSSPTGTPFQNLFSLVPPSSCTSREASEIASKNCATSAANLSLPAAAMIKHHFATSDVESSHPCCDEPPTCCKYTTLCNARAQLGHMKPNRHSCPLSFSPLTICSLPKSLAQLINLLTLPYAYLVSDLTVRMTNQEANSTVGPLLATDQAPTTQKAAAASQLEHQPGNHCFAQ